MEILKNILLVPEIFLMIFLGTAILYFLIFSVASLFYNEKENAAVEQKHKVTILIPSCKEDMVIVETARSAMKHISRHAALDVTVIADSLEAATIRKLENTGAHVLQVSFKESTKVKSLQKALEYVSNDTDYIIVLDADNIMKEGFVDSIMARINEGFRIVQGHRAAKNFNTEIAILDGISEEVNNAIFRRGHRVFGLSASLIGSGFACEYDLFRNLMNEARAVGGFDKELELMLLKSKIKIGYANYAIIYDEKIQQPDAFVNQRRRWLSAQFVYFGQSIATASKQLLKYGNLDYFDKFFQFILPPRILSLGISLLFSVTRLLLTIFSINSNHTFLYYWITLFAISLIAILLAIPANKYNWPMFKSLLFIPKGFLLTLSALFKVRGANKKFIHTQHTIIN